MGNRASIQSAIRNPQSPIPWCVGVAGLYGVLAAYLYRPYFAGFTAWQWLLPVNACLAALGGCLLSRRWVAGFSGSVLAGAVYGFGPFLLGLGKYHPTAGLLAAAIPWLFLPAAFLKRKQDKWIATSLYLLPFVAILLFFYLLAHVLVEHRLFAAPLQARMQPSDLAGFLAPLVLAKRGSVLVGLYHVPVAALVLGLVMMWKARRWSILAVMLIGFLLAFSPSFVGEGKVAWLSVSPILWLSIPLVWCAVLSGIGMQGLIEAGFADRKWVLTATIILGILAIVTLLLAVRYFQILFGLADGYARLFVEAAQMYLLGALATGILFFMVRQKLRAHWLRWAILCAALATDIFLGARHIVDRVL
jgi:hypothetical protein